MTSAVTATPYRAAMGTRRSIDLTPTGANMLRKPVRGRGGFQSLLRKLQAQLDGHHLEVSAVDAERLARYSATYGGGGFQRRTLRVAPERPSRPR